MVSRLSTSILLVMLGTSAAMGQEKDREPPPEVRPLLDEPAMMAKGFTFAEKYMGDREGQRKAGWYPVFKTNVTGDGWISAGSGYRVAAMDRTAWLDGSAAVSWRGYKTAQGTFELIDVGGTRLSLGTQVQWLDATQIQYFGAGPNSPRDLRTDYRLETTDLIGFASYRLTDTVALEARIGRLTRPRISSSSGPFDRGYPDAREVFAAEPGFDVAQQPGFVHTHFMATRDTREDPNHPMSGGVYRAAVANYSDQDSGRFSFRRYELEAVHFAPVTAGRWTLAVHGWTMMTDTDAHQQVPAYLLPSLGGSTTLRSYSDYRFHDRHMLLLSAESRWALFEHVDFALFTDAGSVAARVRDLTLKERSYGAGLRVHVRSSTVARLDVAHGREGWRLLMRLNEPFRLNRLARRTAAAPFVP
jgi:hypothetical protein